MSITSTTEHRRRTPRLPSTPVLVFAAVALCVPALGWLLHERAKALTGHQAEAYLTAVADLKAFEIASWHQDRLDDAEIIAATPYTRSRIREFLENAGQGPSADEMRQYLAARLESKRYNDGLLVDAKGEVRLCEGSEELSLDEEGRADVRAVLDSGRPMVTDLHRSEATGRVHLAIMAPVPGSPAADGSPQRAGVVVFRVDPDVFLYPLVESWPTPSATSETFLCRREGDEVVFLNELRHRKGTALTLRFAVASAVLPAAMVVRGQEGVVRGLDYRGVPVRAVGRRIPDTPWYLIAKTDESEILAPVQLWVWLIVATAASVVLGTGLSLTLWSARRDARRLLRQREADEAVHVQAQVIDQVPGPLISTDLAGNITSWSRGAEGTFGYAADEAIGQHVSLIHPERLRELRQVEVIAPLLEHGLHEVETVLRRESGDEFPAHVSLTVVLDPDGAPAAIIEYVLDLTERVRAEEALRRAYMAADVQRRIAEVFLTVPDEEMYAKVLAILLEAMDSRYGVFGYIDEQGGLVVPTMTRTVWETCDVPNKDIVFPRETWGCSSWPTAIREKRTICQNEPSTLVPEGHVPMHRHISMPIIQQGEVVGLLQVANKPTDYTAEDVALLETVARAIAPVLDARLNRERLDAARVRAQAELRDERDRFESLFETAPLAKLTLDREGRVGMWNAAAEALFGWTAEEAIGQVLLAIPEAERERVLTVLGENLMGGTLSNIELTLRRRDGTPIDVALWSTPVRGPGGEVTGITAIVADIRARRLAEEEARRLTEELEKQVAERTAELTVSNDELEAFAYSVSHDLRAPLRGVDGWTVALMEDCGDQLGEQAHGYLQRVRQEAARMAELIDNLLQLSRVTRSEMQRTSVDVSALASKVVERLRSSDPARQVVVEIEPGVSAEGDPKLLEVALTNLIGNAWKFTGKRPSARIEFGVANAEAECAYYVRDDGVGFDMANAQRLFSPFHRMHRTSDYPGTGIGLATVQRVVHRHGGRVWAAAAVDQGATFYFTLKEA